MKIKYFLTIILFLNLLAITAQKENKAYYETGELQYDYSYVDGKLDGLTKEYHKDGKLKFEWNYKNDVLQGESIGHYEDESITHWYYENSALKEERYYRNKKVYERMYLVDGKRDGKGFRYYPSGEIDTEWVFKDDLPIEGTRFYETGEKKTVFSYLNGVRHGISKEYDKSGRHFRDLNYVNDVRQGITKDYDEDGKVLMEWNYTNNKLKGISKEYFPSGKVKIEWMYKNDLLNGITKEYYENGTLKGSWNYKDDVIQN